MAPVREPYVIPSSLVCRHSGAARGWGVGPLSKVSWAASSDMCALPDLLLWSSLAWRFSQRPWTALAVFLAQHQDHTLKVLHTLRSGGLCHCCPSAGRVDQEVREGQACLKHWDLQTSEPLGPHHPGSLFRKHVHHTGVASRFQAAQGRGWERTLRHQTGYFQIQAFPLPGSVAAGLRNFVLPARFLTCK